MRLLQSICHDPLVLQVGEKSKPPENIRHQVYPVNHEQKTELLLHILKRMSNISSVIIFTSTKDKADLVARNLQKNGIKVGLIHGDRNQAERSRALDSLKSGEYQALVATEIVARGIDIKDLSHVINYDPAETPEAYIHRVGRTGRVDAEGDAITLMDPAEESWILAVEKEIGKTIERVILTDFAYRKSIVAGSYHRRPFSPPPYGKAPRRKFGRR